MSKVIPIKERSFKFSLDIINFLSLNRNISPVIKNQLIRSATSVGANIVEARGSGSKKEFCRFYQIALKSSNETEYWLMLINEGYKKDVKGLMNENAQISKIIAASLITMRDNKK